MHTQALRLRAHSAARTHQATLSYHPPPPCSPFDRVSVHLGIARGATYPVVHHLLCGAPDPPEANQAWAVLFAVHICDRGGRETDRRAVLWGASARG